MVNFFLCLGLSYQKSIQMEVSPQKYDIVIYGATGFTGQLVVEYFAKNVRFSDVKWAIAGRNQDKLFRLKNQLAAHMPELSEMGVFIADTDLPESLEKLAQSAKVVITTVGPYVTHGEPLVKACVEAGTHCLDLSGEPSYVQHIYKYYNFPAERNSAMIINSCGFDSVPADLGAFFTAQQLGTDDDKTIRCYLGGKGSISGGTLSSAMGVIEQVTEADLWEPAHKFGPANLENIHYQPRFKKWALPMPVVDPAIVKRSGRERADIYGQQFSYAQYLGLKYPWMAGGALLGVGALFVASRVEPLKQQILKWRQSGEGPSEEERSNSFFELKFIGTTSNKQVITSVSGGDPGYTETSKMISEAALTIIENQDFFKNKGGVLTPAGALGEKYLNRLQQKGIQFKVLK